MHPKFGWITGLEGLDKKSMRGGANVGDGRVYVVTIDNKTLSFSAKNRAATLTHFGRL